MHKVRLFIALSTLGVLIYCAPASAQSTGGPPDGPHAQAPPPPAPQVVESASPIALLHSTRLALSLWVPSLLQVGSPAQAAARKN